MPAGTSLTSRKMGPAALTRALRRIKLVLMDVDGVLTDGLLFYFIATDGSLVELKGFNAQDSYSLMWLAECGLMTGVISGRRSDGVEARLKMLKVRFIVQGRLDKKDVFRDICRRAGCDPGETLFIGDDFQDVPVMREVGVAVAVSNARPEVKTAAHWVTHSHGGRGAVREVAERLLKAQALWPRILRRFEIGGRP